ncbi:MAG: hypothetical protein ABR887_07445 [Methanoregulaceae archaeon]|jgi:hypothetical protein
MGKQRSANELKEALFTQIGFLNRSARAYDHNNTSEALRMATTLRLLFYNTNRSISLLRQLNKENIKFFDTAFPPPSNELTVIASLVVMTLIKKTLEPILEPVSLERLISFSDWWENNIIIRDSNGITYTRKKIVLTLANTDGGAHLDPKLDDDYLQLKKNKSFGWDIKNPDGTIQQFDTPMAYATVRQITHEALNTFQKEFPDCPIYIPKERTESEIYMAANATIETQSVDK